MARIENNNDKKDSLQIAFRAAVLEQENSILRAQVVALREEVNTLRQMLCNRANNTLPIST